MSDNASWQLEELVDSLVVELDRTRETLAVKAINKPLSYTVKDLALDLNIFPSYDGDQVRFLTAQPGQQGASKITIQLASITDQQVRATSKAPVTRNDTAVDDIALDRKTQRRLRTLGVTSVDDLRNIERKNVDLKKVADNSIDYKALASQIQKSRRGAAPPRVFSASLAQLEGGAAALHLKGENLGLDARFPPVAVLNGELADIAASSACEMTIRLPAQALKAQNELIVACDPYAVLRMQVNGDGRQDNASARS